MDAKAWLERTKSKEKRKKKDRKTQEWGQTVKKKEKEMRRVVQGRRERAPLPGCSLPLGFLNLVALDLSFPRILLAFLSPSITFSSLKSQHRAPLPTETFPEFPG